MRLGLPALCGLLALAGCSSEPAIGVSLEPSVVDTRTTLEVLITLSAEAEAELDPLERRIRWRVDDEARPDLDDLEQVPPVLTTKDQVWRVAVSYGEDGTPAVASRTIIDGPPSATVEITPERPRTDERLVAAVRTDDIDGDNVSLDLSWYVDGTEAGFDGSIVPADQTVRGQVWELRAVPSDGSSEGSVAIGAVRIVDSIPSVLSARVQPREPRTTDTLTCEGEGWFDADGDPEGYRVRWIRSEADDSEIVISREAVLSPGLHRRDERIACELVPFSGGPVGEAVRSEPVLVRNGLPEVGGVSVSPEAPTHEDTVTAEIGPVSDIDDDAVALQLRWFVDDVAVATGTTLSPTRYARGQSIRIEVTPDDGLELGETAVSNVVVGGNNAPFAFGAAIAPTELYTDTPARGAATTVDPDGDALTLRYAWTVNGSAATSTTDTLSADVFEKGDAIVFSVTPDDGLTAGATATSSTVTVRNTPPTAPGVRITPAAPEAGESLRCVLDEASTDSDDDSLSYRVAWSRGDSAYTSTSTTTLTGDTIPADVTGDAELWSCSIRAFDGDDLGPESTAAAIVGDLVFTPCGATGASGPSSRDCASAYAGTSLADDVTVVSGRQDWTVPITGTWRIEAWGAAGAHADGSRRPGYGARMIGEFALDEGDELKLYVGQQGLTDGCGGGGGGASWVYTDLNALLMVAGGGGGGRSDISRDGCDAITSRNTNHNSLGSTACFPRSSGIGSGGGASSSVRGGGGAGRFGDGVDNGSGCGSCGGTRALLGGDGGLVPGRSVDGGFGGGGAGYGSSTTWQCGAGGGGGYTGGWVYTFGGGGGSYNTGSRQDNASGVITGDGRIVFRYVP